MKGDKMIKKPSNFAVGIFCLLCFIINIVNHKDMFTLVFSAFVAAGNITIGLTGKNDD